MKVKMKVITSVKTISIFTTICLLFGSTSVFAEPSGIAFNEYDTISQVSNGDTINDSVEFENIEDYFQGNHSEFTASATSSYDFYGTNVVPDGIYAFKNLGNSERWMDIQYDSSEPGARVQQYAYNNSPAEYQTQLGLYKITQIGNTGRYVIRLMINQNLSFSVSGTDIYTKTISSNDSEISINDTFYIEYNGGGYTIRPYGSSYYISAKNTTASGADCAIGFLDGINGDSANTFTEMFFHYLNNGYSIDDAAYGAASHCSDPRLSHLNIVYR